MSLQDSGVSDYDNVWHKVYGDMQDCGPTHRHMRRLLARVLQNLEYSSVLEVGCGQGHNLPALMKQRKISRFTGVDISQVALDHASRMFPDGEFIKIDVESGCIPGQWDLVFCSLVLEHLPHDVEALRNMHAMTGKYLVATTIAGDFERYRGWDVQMGHVRNYQRGELEGKLQSVGFNVLRSIYWGFPFYSPIARTVQNFSAAGTGKFSVSTWLIAQVLNAVYYLNSHRRGDLLIVVAEP